MENKKEAGVLCHISSLWGKYGIGSLGKEARSFAKILKKSGVKYWQILPLVQTGYGDSPYQSVSCTSGNPYFIDLPTLKKEGLLKGKELKAAETEGGVDFGTLYESRFPLLRKAFSRFHFDSDAFRAYVKQGEHEDYALFMTAKSVYGGSFCDWPSPIKNRDSGALEELRTSYHEEYLFWHFLQYEFSRQWKGLKDYCNGLGIQIIGDIPLYVAYDSADVWSHPELFKLDKELKPEKVAGVPPDYFSETGQLWGNPIYDWDAHIKEGFRWWHARLKSALETYDYVRIDHFRGLDRYFEIDAGAETAVGGTWKDGPRELLFKGINRKKIIAEDLGCIDEGVTSLLKRTGLPGMKVLLFAFDGNPENDHLPHNIPENCVCYTGTHDNDTVCGYVSELSAEEFILFRSRVAQELERCGYHIPLGESGREISEAFVHMAMASKAKLAIVPIQDVLALGQAARMNFPGKEEGNWQFRLKRLPSPQAMARLKKIINLYRR